MKKTILLSVLLIFTAMYSMAADTIYGLESCERYGTNVVLTFSALNNDNLDYSLTFEEHPCTVLDADGNEYRTSRMIYGTLKNYSSRFDGTLIGATEVNTPIGKNEVYNPVALPAGVKLLLRIVVTDVPESLTQFQTIQLRGKKMTSEDNFTLFCFNWNSTDYKDDVTIKEGK